MKFLVKVKILPQSGIYCNFSDQDLLSIIGRKEDWYLLILVFILTTLDHLASSNVNVKLI